MSIELKVPSVGESITEVMIGEWLVKEGDHVEEDAAVVIIETDKVNVELPAPTSGTITKILKGNGEDAEVGEVVGHMEAGESAPAKPAEEAEEIEAESGAGAADEPRVMPAAQKLLAQHSLDASDVKATGPGGRLLKEDVLRHVEEASRKPAPATSGADTPAEVPAAPTARSGARDTERVKMTPLRRKVASRLVQAQEEAALLTTFNEVDMSAVMALRSKYKQAFLERYDIKLGFMSFFVKAAVEALKEIPQVNAMIDGDEIIYHNYQDIGVAVGGGKGLVVPVLRNTERMSFADVEKSIADLAGRALKGQLQLDELQGGTFTISNGGVYGSLLSTPIVNPPQSGILGLHKIEERPIALNGEVVIRPMMYLALTYDHRIIDGREAVTFLVKIKERIEDPARILLEV
ncbi:MAG: 2-oxoglutarate dehydrogenase complex dihydrolipoyllysine-residue succinyltransferase [Thermoanaerobaculia bacterium]|nr:2-oxoglutarate dehydrogenase complex dihydrolipoyllysine-residue succinyltransferase [Thermoanaerobaculia bacterium]